MSEKEKRRKEKESIDELVRKIEEAVDRVIEERLERLIEEKVEEALEEVEARIRRRPRAIAVVAGPEGVEVYRPGRGKVIAIRGVDEEVFQEVKNLARRTGRTIGSIVTEALRMALEGVQGFGEGLAEAERWQKVAGLDELEVTRRDLEEADKPLVFSRIRRLIIADDVPYDLFDQKVHAIRFVDELRVPKDYPKLRVLRKCKFVRRLVRE